MEHFLFTRGVGLTWLLNNPFAGKAEQKVVFHKELCRHSGSCVVNAYRAAVKGLMMGYAITLVIAIFRIIASKRRRKRVIHHVHKALVNKQHSRFARFLATFLFSIKSLNCFLRWNRGCEDGFNSILAGATAGLTLFSMNRWDGRSDLALYVWSRAVDVVTRMAMGTHSSNFPSYSSAIVFCVLQSVIIHGFMFERRNVRKSYAEWIALIAGRGDEVTDYLRELPEIADRNNNYTPPTKKEMPRGLQGSVTAFELLMGTRKSEVNLIDHSITEQQPEDISTPLSDSKAVKVNCKRYHDSCVLAAGSVFMNGFREAFKMYLPLYVVPSVFSLLVRKPKQTTTTTTLIKNLILNPIFGAMRSSIFLGAYSAIVIATVCCSRPFISKENSALGVVAGGLSGLSIFLESSRRHAELSLYCLPRAAETAFNRVLERWCGTAVKFHELPGLDVVVFSWSCGVLFWALQHRPDTLRSSVRVILTTLLGDN